MTQINQPVAIAVSASEDETEYHACEWRCDAGQTGDHPDKWHLRRPDYSATKQRGNAARKNGYSEAWKKANRVPWSQGEGIDPRRWPDAYHIRRHNPAPSYRHPEYATEGHHLISCDLFREADFPVLVHNALLVGYDINCEENGWHFPAHIVDIICHNHQHHASQHAWSEPAQLKYDLDELVAPLLANLEERVANMCRPDLHGTTDHQQNVVDILARLSRVIRRKLQNWQWYLTKLAQMRLGQIRDYGVRLSNVEHESESFLIVHRSKGLKYVDRATVRMVQDNLSLGGFSHFDHYVAAAIEELEAGANPQVPFSWWLSRRLYRERIGRASGPNSPEARAG